jgi:hypothetical protein
MPYDIRFAKAPAGYAMENSAAGEERLVKIAVREFTSSEDGELFMSRLEGVPSEVLGMLPVTPPILPSAIDHLIAVIAPDLSARVYVNECNVFINARSNRSFKAGEPVREDDIVDVKELRFEGVDFRADCGVLCVFSVGWRKGFFFDLTPLGPDAPRREYDIQRLLGSYYSYVAHQKMFRLDDDAWNRLVEQQWFPFISLPKQMIRSIATFARAGDSIDGLLPEIANQVRELAPRMVERWSQHAVWAPHIELLRHAVSEFLEGDVVSATAILYPRIEGVLRSIHEGLGIVATPSQKVLSAAAVQSSSDPSHPHSWLLPERFRWYLEEAYFANFQPGQPAKVSRNSVGHGVASAANFNLKAACVGLLVVDQLYWLLPPESAGGSPRAELAS